MQQHAGYSGWNQGNETTENQVNIQSVREGMIAGIHNVEWESEVDKISLRHESKSRKGLAFGAVAAAEFIYTRKGVFTMNDVLGF